MKDKSFYIIKDPFFSTLGKVEQQNYLKSLLIFSVYYGLDLILLEFSLEDNLRSELELCFANFSKNYKDNYHNILSTADRVEQLPYKLAQTPPNSAQIPFNSVQNNRGLGQTSSSSIKFIDKCICEENNNIYKEVLKDKFILDARDYLAENQSIIKALTSRDRSLLQFSSDLDKRLVERLAIAELRLLTKFRLATELPFFGPGPQDVLKKIDELGRVRQVADDLSISYSKLWKILEKIELCLGSEVVSRQQGGAGGGHASLNDKGKALLAFYNRLDNHLSSEAKEYFAKNFPFEIFFD